jgi:hypothetical protein
MIGWSQVAIAHAFSGSAALNSLIAVAPFSSTLLRYKGSSAILRGTDFCVPVENVFNGVMIYPIHPLSVHFSARITDGVILRHRQSTAWIPHFNFEGFQNRRSDVTPECGSGDMPTTVDHVTQTAWCVNIGSIPIHARVKK